MSQSQLKRKPGPAVDEPPSQRAALPVNLPSPVDAQLVEEHHAALRRVRLLSSQRAAHSFKLAELLLQVISNSFQMDQQFEKIADCLKKDAEREEPFIDLSMQLHEGGRTVLMLLMSALKKIGEGGAGGCESSRAASLHMSNEAVWAHVAKLVQSYDVSILHDGNSALHVLATAIQQVPETESAWTYRLAELLITRGADIQALDSKRRTPLKLLSMYGPLRRSTVGLQLLVLFGAGAARDDNGGTILHWIVRDGNAAALQQLGERGLLAHVDLFAVDEEGKRALQLANLLAANEPNDDHRRSIRLFLSAQTQAWRRHVQPLLDVAANRDRGSPASAAATGHGVTGVNR